MTIELEAVPEFLQCQAQLMETSRGMHFTSAPGGLYPYLKNSGTASRSTVIMNLLLIDMSKFIYI